MPAEVGEENTSFCYCLPYRCFCLGRGGVLFGLRASGVCVPGLCSHLSQVLLVLAGCLWRVSGGREGQFPPVARNPFPQNDQRPLFYSMLISNNKWITIVSLSKLIPISFPLSIYREFSLVSYVLLGNQGRWVISGKKPLSINKTPPFSAFLCFMLACVVAGWREGASAGTRPCA